MTAAEVTLCFLLRDVDGRQDVLLGLKKTGFGTGKVVGIGGHLEPGESAAQAICREVAEEVYVHVAESSLLDAGTVDFVFPAKPQWNMHTTVFLSRRWEGQPTESSEIAPQWHPVNTLPHELMWADSLRWLPRMLAGERLAVRVVLNADNETVAQYSAEPVG